MSTARSSRAASLTTKVCGPSAGARRDPCAGWGRLRTRPSRLPSAYPLNSSSKTSKHALASALAYVRGPQPQRLGRGCFFLRQTWRRTSGEYPALLDITEGGPVGALVLARNAVAGDIWELAGRAAVGETIILGANRTRVFPLPPAAASPASSQHSRQALLFGAGRAGSAFTAAHRHRRLGRRPAPYCAKPWLTWALRNSS